jgi:23S rRNA (adenine2503-C2)-methyltransferase
VNLLGATPRELAAEVDCSEAEARRVLAWLVSHGSSDLRGMKRPVSKALRARIQAHTWARPSVLARVEDPQDHSLRYLFELDDGARVEAVRIPLEKPGRFSVCLSSQVGCAMRCDFCATGRLGLRRNLSAAEILGTWLTVRDEAPGRVTGSVFMGQGEPFHNYDEVLRAASILAHPCGGRVSAKSITISTVGLVPQIHRYADERQPFRLVVSLTSAVPERRKQLLPMAARWSLEELAEALARVQRVQGRRMTLAWVLIGGLTDQPDEVAEIARVFGDMPLRINLIDVNEARDEGYRRASPERRDAFIDALQALEAPVVRRYSVGATQNSACGMLASAYQEESPCG